MIELKDCTLKFSFPEVHEDAVLEVTFQRTLRIPDNDGEYPLPAGLGPFPVRLVDDHPETIPDAWMKHGGVMLPMYQSEAMWILFESVYPFAVKVGAGKINAITGEAWSDEFGRDPQNYLVTPFQPWLDGFCVEKGIIRQFVAMPLGSGHSAEEQLTGKAEHGGLQILVSPLRSERYLRMPDRNRVVMSQLCGMMPESVREPGMGLAPGGRMRQEIFRDRFDWDDWDFSQQSRCFVHMANSMTWREITGSDPPSPPLTEREYKAAGIPWFDLYAEDETALAGAKKLSGLKSVKAMDEVKAEDGIRPEKIVILRRGLRRNQVREGDL